TIFLIIIGTLVFIGVKFVSKFAPVALICVLVSILSVYLGIFVNYNGTIGWSALGLAIELSVVPLSQASTSTRYAPSMAAFYPIRTTSPARKMACATCFAT